MREVIFRAWYKEGGYMMPVEEIDFNQGLINKSGIWRWFHEVELMQYTGLEDRNGVKIFEGDLVERDDDLGDGWETYEASEIVFDEDYLQYCFRWDTSNFLLNYKNLNVVGNIYENSELLEG